MKPGKKSKISLATRRKWLLDNPANHEGAYLCSICARPVHESQVELDHVMGRKGELLSKQDNLLPTHRWCNQRKGSQKWQPKVSKAEYELRRLMDL